MFCAILKATNSSFQEGMIICRSIYVKKVMKLLAFIFEQSSILIYFKTTEDTITIYILKLKKRSNCSYLDIVMGILWTKIKYCCCLCLPC